MASFRQGVVKVEACKGTAARVAAIRHCVRAVLGPLVVVAPIACSGGAVAARDGGSEETDATVGDDATTGAGSPISDGGITDAPAASDGNACILKIPADSGMSQWAAIGADGQLTYATLPTGERLLDFSYAGYMGGGVAIPTVATGTTVSPSGGDDTAAIQAAIDSVSNEPLKNGFRGAVVLAAGTFKLSGSLAIAASGVVLRGAGSGASGTTLEVTGSPRT